MFTTGSTSKSQSFELNVDNVEFGFIAGTETKAQESYKYRDILVSDRNCTTSGGAKVTIDINVTNSTFDLVTNAQSNATIGTLKENSANDNCYTDYNLLFEGCTFKASKPEQVACVKSSSGDTVKFIKNENDGSYGHLLLPTGAYEDVFVGIDGEYEVEVKPVHKNGVYYLVEISDAETAYGTIPAAYSNSYAYPYAIFMKVDGAYVFDSVQSNVNTSFTRATELTHAKTGVTDDVVILTRRSIGADGTFPLNNSDIGGTVTLDLNGYTIRPTTALLRTDWDDDGVVDGVQKKATVNIKNGAMELSQFGILFTTVTSSYTVPKTFDINLDNVKLSFYETTGSNTAENYKWRDLLVSDRSNSATTKAYINIKATDCTFDLATNAQANAVLGTLECGSNDHDTNDYKIEIIGGTIITDDFAKVSCVTKGTGDSLAFKKGADGKYPKILINQALAEPSGTEYRNGEDGKTVSVMETSARVGVYKVYEFCEDVMTKYGRIPLAASVNDFAVFARNGEEAYAYYGAYGGWKLAFEAARNATNGSSTAYDEAVVFMLRDSVETSVPYHQDACGIINVDLNGKKLIVKGSFFNTNLVKSNSPTSTINVFDGTLLTYRYGLIYTAIKSDDTTYETAGVEKTITLNFSNVDLGFDEYTGGSHKSLTAYAYSGSAALNMTVNMNFDNCTFDLVTNAQTTTLLGNGKSVASATTNANTVDFNLAFTDCEFLVYSPTQIAMSMSEEGDSFVINKGSDGKYATVFTNSSKEEVYADIIPGFDGTNSVKLRTSYLGLEDGNAKYELIETDGNITITTSYGVIPTNYTNLASYPFAVFYKDAAGKYQFKAGYATYKEAMTAAIALTTAAIASPSSEAVVLLRTDWSGGDFPSNLSNIATTVTVDLDGHTLGALESLGNTTTGDVKDPNGNIVKTNGTINYKNGRILLKVHPGIYIAKGTTYTAGYQKTLNVNYDNVYIGMAEGAKTIALLGRIASYLTTETAIFNIKYTGCTIDMATNYSTGANFIIGNWAPASGTDATKVTVDFIDCDFLGLTEADFQHRITAGQDVVRYTSTSGDNYATLTLPKGASAPEGTYTAGSLKCKFVKLSETETTVTYGLVKAPEEPPVVTDYGTIPSDYVNATSYPFAVFSKLNGGEYSFSGAYSKWSTAMKAAQSLIAAANGATTNDYVAILLRKDFNIGADLYSDTSYMGGHLILDLDGHTMTLGTSLMSIRAFDYDTGKTCTTYVTVKNGSLVNNTKYGIIYSRIEETCTVEKTYYLDFDNVNFSFGASATSKTLLIHSFEQNNRSGSCKINVAYDNCFFDFDTNVPEGAGFLNLKSVSVVQEDDLDFTVVFNGCTFEGAGAFDIPLGEGDSVTFGDGTILKVANGTAAPTGTYVTNNGNAKLVKTAAVDGNYTIYTLLKESIASYAPKTSLTLDTNLVMNVYLPVESTLKFTFDGVNYENLADLSENVVTLENGEKYYHVVIALPAAEAAKDMKLAVTVGDDAYSVVANFTFSTLKYAGKLIAGGSEIEKQLAKDVVAYIQAAYNYFVTLNTAEEIARVDTLASELLVLGGDYNGEPTSSGATVTASPVTSVTLNLGDNPTIRFYVTDTSVEFYIGTRKLQTVKGTDATHGAYVEIDEYAYMLCETITYGEGGSYHISSFLEGAAGEDHENLVACFIKYTESAADYRKSVIN